MKGLVQDEKGAALILVLVLLAMGALLIFPMLGFAFTAQASSQVQTRLLMDQYSRDAGSEYAVWQLLHGGATALLSGEGEETTFPLELNGVSSTVRIRLQAELSNLQVGGAEDNRVRLTSNVECEITPPGPFDDDCLNLPSGVVGMEARYTMFLDQVSPDDSVTVVAVYDELPSKFDWSPLGEPVVSLDGSFPEILSITPTNIGSEQNQIWKWDFSAAPLSFVQGQVRQFSFVATMDTAASEYCNRSFTKMSEAPHESSGPSAIINLGSTEGCDNGGTLVSKYVNQPLALPGNTTVFTYVVNVENIEKNSQQLEALKDVLPQGGFLFCNGPTQGDPLQSCDPPMYKLVGGNADQNDPDTFTDTAGYSLLPDPTLTYLSASDRWELIWDDGWGMTQAGMSQDTLIMRFQAEFTPVASGSFYNEIFVDVNCSVPSVLKTAPNAVSSQADYCASYSWPTGGSLVPTYDIRAETDSSNGWGNITVGSGSGQLQSWHVENN